MDTYQLNQEERFSQAHKRVKSMKGFYIHATVFVFVNAFIIFGCAIDDVQHLFTPDPYMTALFWGIGLSAHGFAVFGQNFILGRTWEEKEIQKILNR